VAAGSEGWSRFLELGLSVPAVAVDERAAGVGEQDEGLILFSSGTSAEPKGMVHRHRAPTLQFHIQAGLFRRTTSSRVWAPLPLFWTAGLTTAMGSTLAGGGTFVMQEVFDAGEALRLMERERVTEPYVLPHQGAALAAHPDWERTNLSSLREVFGKSVFSRHPTVTGDPSWVAPAGYGMSETCAGVIGHSWDTPRDEVARCTGRLMPGVRLRVLDPDSVAVLPDGATGELAIAGPTVLVRYLDRTAAETLDADGFLRTGDLGYVEPDGAVHWLGRLTEMIKTAGANVAPAEIETALRTCRDVARARVVGLPDRILGEIVTLCVELVDGSTATAEDLKSFLAGRVAAYKVPREVVLFASGEMPTTASGAKVRNDQLIALAASRLGRAIPARTMSTPEPVSPPRDPGG
jgi:acyl-CoA synthetase (AMP-forming)/AMP-acid ligase II